MAQHIDSRTIHTIHIDVTDDVLAVIESGNEVEVVLHARSGSTAAKKLTYRDIENLIDGTSPGVKRRR